MKSIVILCFALCANLVSAKDYIVKSPDGNLTVTVEAGEKTTYSVNYNGQTILSPSPLSMTFDNGIVIGDNMKVNKVERTATDQVLKPIIKQKCAEIRDHYNEMILKSSNYQIHFRVYDDGLAYRFRTDFSRPLKVMSEEVDYCFPEDYNTLFPEERTMLSPQQPLFKPMKLSEIATNKFCSTPILIKADDKTRIFISESDLESYPGMFLEKQGDYELKGKFAAVSTQERRNEDRQIFPVKRADYIAQVAGKRNYPWRAMIVTDNDANLLTNQLTYKLAPEPEVKDDFAWVKPGKIAWDWWNALILTGVDFKTGINTFTRMVAGPMDYTPGGMINLHAKDFKINFNLPATIGTRCHQLGMYVVYESPLQMLADSPSNYREPECMEFLSAVPAVWDERPSGIHQPLFLFHRLRLWQCFSTEFIQTFCPLHE